MPITDGIESYEEYIYELTSFLERPLANSIMNTTCVNFFTDNLWSKLPEEWQEALSASDVTWHDILGMREGMCNKIQEF